MIDLGDAVSHDQAALRGLHFLVYRYADWLWVVGAGPVAQGALEDTPGLQDRLAALFRNRLYPSPLQRAERDVIAQGAGARRTREWIDRSTMWTVGDERADADAWAARVRGLAERVETGGGRAVQQRDTAFALLKALYDDAFADAAVYDGFDELVRYARENRDAFLSALLRTAQRPASDSGIADAAREAVAFGAPLSNLLVETP